MSLGEGTCKERNPKILCSGGQELQVRTGLASLGPCSLTASPFPFRHSRCVHQLGDRLRAVGRQSFPYQIREGLSVIRSTDRHSDACALNSRIASHRGLTNALEGIPEMTLPPSQGRAGLSLGDLATE